jgi:hypothetical protein
VAGSANGETRARREAGGISKEGNRGACGFSRRQGGDRGVGSRSRLERASPRAGEVRGRAVGSQSVHTFCLGFEDVGLLWACGLVGVGSARERGKGPGGVARVVRTLASRESR